MPYEAASGHPARYRVEEATALANRDWASHRDTPARRRSVKSLLRRPTLVLRRSVVRRPQFAG